MLWTRSRGISRIARTMPSVSSQCVSGKATPSYYKLSSLAISGRAGSATTGTESHPSNELLALVYPVARAAEALLGIMLSVSSQWQRWRLLHGYFARNAAATSLSFRCASNALTSSLAILAGVA